MSYESNVLQNPSSSCSGEVAEPNLNSSIMTNDLQIGLTETDHASQAHNSTSVTDINSADNGSKFESLPVGERVLEYRSLGGGADHARTVAENTASRDASISETFSFQVS